MKCETNAQLHDALTALIESAAGTEREALQAIQDYTDERYSAHIDLEAKAAEAERIAKERYATRHNLGAKNGGKK